MSEPNDDLKLAAGRPLESGAIASEVRAALAAGAKITGYLVQRPDGTEYGIRANGDHRRPAKIRQPKQPQALIPPSVPGYWLILDHLCSDCFGRLLSRLDGPDAGLLRCSMCGATHRGAIEELCACGMRLDLSKDLGIRCAPNPNRSPSIPFELAVVRGEPVPSTGQRALPMRVKI